jgi:hypothetical protein
MPNGAHGVARYVAPVWTTGRELSVDLYGCDDGVVGELLAIATVLDRHIGDRPILESARTCWDSPVPVPRAR